MFLVMLEIISLGGSCLGIIHCRSANFQFKRASIKKWQRYLWGFYALPCKKYMYAYNTIKIKYKEGQTNNHNYNLRIDSEVIDVMNSFCPFRLNRTGTSIQEIHHTAAMKA